MSEQLHDPAENIQEKISFITSTHNQQQLVYNNQRYCLKQNNKNSKLWRCTRQNCTASVSISLNNIIIRKNDNHNHFIECNEVKLVGLRHHLKKEAQTTSIPIDKLIEDNYSKFIVKENITDTLVKIPNIKTLKNTISKQRRKVRPALPHRLEDLPSPIPNQYTFTHRNMPFLLYDGLIGTKRGLLFSTISDIQYLSKQSWWYSDGTFYSCPSIFYQIYSIHAFDDGLSTPCLFALLADKNETTYQHLFMILIEKIKEFSNIIHLRSITIDFELGVKNAVQTVFPHVEVKGCLFHYGQSLFRKFVNLGLKTAYQNDEKLRNWFRSFAATALLPLTEVKQSIQSLCRTKPNEYSDDLSSFVEYHKYTYGINSNFPPSMYNHHNMNPRTINYLEGTHNRWKKRTLKAHDDIYRCIDLFKNEQLLYNDARERTEAGEPPPKKTKKNRMAEESLLRLWSKYQNNKINRQTFLKAAGLRCFQSFGIE